MLLANIKRRVCRKTEVALLMRIKINGRERILMMSEVLPQTHTNCIRLTR